MDRFVIKGKEILSGEVSIQGAKNAAQKILPATIVFPGEYLLKNIPAIQDSFHLVEILEFLGAKVEFLDGHTLSVDTREIISDEIPSHITAKSTGSFLFAGALLSRFGRVKIWHPGGDQIGLRRVTWHLDAFRQLGASVDEEEDFYTAFAKALQGCEIEFPRLTVNGTVNAILASVCAEGITLLKNVPLDPEIDNFIDFINAAGAEVRRANGGHEIHVTGAEGKTGHATFSVMSDRNDAATFLIAAALCKGPAILRGVETKHLEPLIRALRLTGVVLKSYQDESLETLEVRCDQLIEGRLNITSQPAPGFSTDWGPMMQVFLTQVPGTSTFHETVFSQRFSHLKYVAQMGGEIEYFNPPADDSIYNFVRVPDDQLFHAVRITGPVQLVGRLVDAENVRAGAALAIAGLIAKGTTTITNIYQIDRGYEDFGGRLARLGATIERIGTV